MKPLLCYYSTDHIEAGIDEAGRGCLAGPVVAAAVILSKHFSHPELNDSKQLTEKQRKSLEILIKKQALDYSIAIVDNNVIDEINILNATFKAMNMAVAGLRIKPGLLLIDGNRYKPNHQIDFKCIVKGDSIYNSIAAASILAKTCRDKLMTIYHNEFPVYNWIKNKGYPTAEHREAIIRSGDCTLHRKSFRLHENYKQLKLDL